LPFVAVVIDLDQGGRIVEIVSDQHVKVAVCMLSHDLTSDYPILDDQPCKVLVCETEARPRSNTLRVMRHMIRDHLTLPLDGDQGEPDGYIL
jgi:hypothetical protein